MVTEQSRTTPVRRLSVPGPGRTMIGTVERWNEALSTAHRLLANEFALRTSAMAAFDRTFAAAPSTARGSSLPLSGRPQLASAMLLAVWLASRTRNPRGMSLQESAYWFTGDLGERLTAEMKAETLSATETVLAELPSGDVLDEVLPYVLESLEHGAIPGEHSRVAYRRARRTRGVYYTPSDVSDYVVGVVLSSALDCGDELTCLDPACGSGVFLRSALDFLSSRTQMSAVDICTTSLFGFDISPLSVLSASFVLLSRVLKVQHDSLDAPREAWLAIQRNLVAIDATTVGREEAQASFLGAPQSLEELFPSAASGFAAVVGNPPYTALPQDDWSPTRAQLFSTASVASRSGVPAYPLFAEMMWRFTRSDCAGAGMVLPLSIAHNSGSVFSTLRREMRATDASWRFHFFDRTPDSLFGDDVKTRSAIAFMRRNGAAQSIATSPLRRWNSRTRQELFSTLSTVQLTELDIGPFVPKLGSALEVTAYDALKSRRQLGELFSRSRTTRSERADSTLYCLSTAYNWLPILRRKPTATSRSGRSTVSSSVRTLRCRSPEDASYAFAVLSSRLAYWLWRVECDGFHLTSAFLHRVPFHPSGMEPAAVEHLRHFGSLLWAEMEKTPVFATNAGLTTENFSPTSGARYIDAIDEVLVEQYELGAGLPSYLRQFQTDVIDAERDGGPDEYSTSKR